MLKQTLALFLFLIGSRIDALTFSEVHDRITAINNGLVTTCSSFATNNSQNYVIIAALLRGLFGRSYGELIITTFLDNQSRLQSWCRGFIDSSGAHSSITDFADYLVAIAQIEALAGEIRADVEYNYVFMCMFLREIGGRSYHELINSTFDANRDLAVALLNRLQGIVVPTPLPTVPVVVPVRTSIPDASKSLPPLPTKTASAKVATPVAGAGTSGVPTGDWRAAATTACPLSWNFPVNNFCIVDDAGRAQNRAQLFEFPLIGQYNPPGVGYYAFGDNVILIKNNSIDALLSANIPANIKSQIPADYVTDFYTEVVSWDITQLTNGSGFRNKSDGVFNILFHGPMMTWFADKYPAFNFSSDGVGEHIDMGVFNFDGVTPQDLGSNVLRSLSVNPHNMAYSPDNARFKIVAGRDLVVFWSVAKSTTKKRAIVTYHVLYNANKYGDFARSIIVAARARAIGSLFVDLAAVPRDALVAADRGAWDTAITFLSGMYGV